jgi:type III restriction enzyme
MVSLFPFQAQASIQIVDRFIKYLEAPPAFGTMKSLRPVSFFQRLDGLTGSGKTVILADAVSEMAQILSPSPLVLWVSKGKVVVDQTLENLAPGGKYNSLLPGIRVSSLNSFTPEDLERMDLPQLLVTTVGLFNRIDKDKASLRIHQKGRTDTSSESFWSSLTSRRLESGEQRPLIVVYDEAHNLSDQQTELLMELRPTAILLASATMRLPHRLGREVQILKDNGWTDEKLITRISDSDVVNEGLVKASLHLAGYQTPMEVTVDSMLRDMEEATVEAADLNLPWRPKAIYVSETNRVADNAFRMDDPRRDFREREASPIVIWRYLTDQKNIDPAEIVVYADLKTDPDFPLPAEFNLLSQGENDYARFIEGNYRHVIFNLTLQEGWDDPTCYFAYIDKSMESNIQITQVIGRAIRQPNAERYPSPRLNQAHFYVRVDHKKTFKTVLDDVEGMFKGDERSLKVIISEPGSEPRVELFPRVQVTVPEAATTSPDATNEIEKLVQALPDFRENTVNVQGEGSRKVSVKILGGDVQDGAWITEGVAASVSARWACQREVKREKGRALGYLDLNDGKFDAQVGLGSSAYQSITRLARDVVQSYLDNAELSVSKSNPYKVKGVLARDSEIQRFKNSVHEGYAGLNDIERAAAESLDLTGKTWARNPASVGYGIELPSPGPTSNFYPDFLVWDENAVICLETKGAHLMTEAIDRKLLNIRNRHEVPDVMVRFISEGKWSSQPHQQVHTDGYTLWKIDSSGQRKATHYDEMDEVVHAALTVGS